MAYFNSLYFSGLSFDVWQKSQNRMLVDYRKFKESGQESGAARRTWTLVANAMATIGWGILSIPKAVFTFGRLKNHSWQHAREAGSRTKASLYAMQHFKPLMATFRGLEARACYKSIDCKWDKDDRRWKELARLSAQLTPEGFDFVWKEVSQGVSKTDFLKDLWKQPMSKELNEKVRKELFKTGFVVKQGYSPQLYPVPFVEKMLTQKFPALAPKAREALAAKGSKELRIDDILDSHDTFKCGELLKKFEAEQAVKEGYARQLRSHDWNNWQEQLKTLKVNHLLKVADELPNLNQHQGALKAMHTALYSRMQKLDMHLRWSNPPNPKHARQIGEIRPKLETMRLALFDQGYVTGVASSGVMENGHRRDVYETIIYPKEFMEIIQNPDHPKFNQKVATAMATGGRAAAALSQDEKTDLNNFIEGNLDGWTVKDIHGRVQRIIVDGLDLLAARSTILPTPFAQALPEFFNPSYALLHRLCPALARGIIDGSVPLTEADAAALNTLLTRFPNDSLKTALLLWSVRQANAATLAPLIAPLRNCPNLDEILPELIEAPVLLDPAVNIPGLADLKDYLGQRVIRHPTITRRERSINAAAIAGLISFDQMCEVIRRPEFTFAGWSDWLTRITARPIYNSAEELARIAWRQNPAQVRNLQSVILFKSTHPQNYSLNWEGHLARVWDIADDEGKLSMLQQLIETNWWQRLPWAGTLRDFAQTDLALHRQTGACNKLLAYCMGHSRDPNGPNLAFGNPGQMLVNSLRWELPNLRDTCIEQILRSNSHDIEYNLRNDQCQGLIRALGQTGARLHREEAPPLPRLAHEALTLFQLSKASEFGSYHHSYELGRACKMYLTRHAAEYREVVDLNVEPHQVEHARRRQEQWAQNVIEEWNQARAFIERALGRR